MSKIFYNLYDKICHPLNLWWAHKDAARGKRYQPAAAFFEYDLEKNLVEMEQELKDETYQLGGYHSFRIEKPKRRLVNAAPFRDRVLHHALMNVIEPPMKYGTLSFSRTAVTFAVTAIGSGNID